MNMSTAKKATTTLAYQYDDGTVGNNNNTNSNNNNNNKEEEEEEEEEEADDAILSDDDSMEEDKSTPLATASATTGSIVINDVAHSHPTTTFISQPIKYANPVQVYVQPNNNDDEQEKEEEEEEEEHYENGNDNDDDDEDEDDNKAKNIKSNNSTTRTTKQSPYKLPSSKDFKEDQNNNWETMFYNIMVYRAYNSNNTINDIRYNSENTQEQTLYRWIQNQKKHYKMYMGGKKSSSVLNEERIKVLESIGMEWNIRGDGNWDRMYGKLVQYKKENDDCLVPRMYKKDKRLGEWVTDQRRQYKFKKNNKPSLLTEEREKKLNEVEFTWQLRERLDWNERFEQLAKFKQEHGHCIVPQLYNKNKGLGKWVSKQREQYKNLLDGKYSFITNERISQLDQLGFSWNAKGRRSTESLMGCNLLKLPQSGVPVVQQETAHESGAATTATMGDTSSSTTTMMLPMNTDDNENNGHHHHNSSVSYPFMTRKSDDPESMLQNSDDMNSSISYDRM